MAENEVTKIQRDVFTVSRLNREVRDILEGNFPLIWLEGELSNVSRPASGHLYFSLKDASAQVSCAMFRNKNQLIQFKPEDGMQVLVRARVSVYEARGNYQLIIEHMEEAGDGALQRAFEVLKKKLASEGLFEEAHKKSLPILPKQIGVITSPSGAAIRDILTVLKRRFPSIPVVIYPVPVQGEDAKTKIVNQLKQASERGECDVIILARGGGSLEDLWAFNEEMVARAIFDCTIPVINAVGHEIDFTIADFVADVRAATPSMAAELATPDQQEWRQSLDYIQSRFVSVISKALEHRKQQLDWLSRRLRHPGRYLQDMAQKLDEQEQRMKNAIRSTIKHTVARVSELQAHIYRHTPLHRIRQQQQQCQSLFQRTQRTQHDIIHNKQQHLTLLARALDAVSPLATLDRGYAIVNKLPENRLVRKASELKAGDQIETRLGKGRIISTVTGQKG
ncbi:MAG: exodeoxyribonuclease VII large subunit [Gammaproteobacteria bacterium]|nr:exodeoxyribonuclease VII large subunit [Gammaproteobacteria bacterium]MDH5593253.1 exodeoxyribonuclease VII large subunit [Gammaproteobacteria bacterium]MDH5613490.1 exodeoxyribonuclease VII large subunit [Gammaproteobacteria bacterium]